MEMITHQLNLYIKNPDLHVLLQRGGGGLYSNERGKKMALVVSQRRTKERKLGRTEIDNYDRISNGRYIY